MGGRTTYVINYMSIMTTYVIIICQKYVYHFQGVITFKKNLISPFFPTLWCNSGVNGFFCPVSLKICSWALLLTHTLLESASIYPSMKHLLPCWDVLQFAANSTLPWSSWNLPHWIRKSDYRGDGTALQHLELRPTTIGTAGFFPQGRLGRGGANKKEASESHPRGRRI